MTELVPLHILSPHSPRFISPERNATTPSGPRIRSIPRFLHPDLAVDFLSFMLAVSEDEIMDRDIQLSADQAEEEEREGGASSRSYSP